MENESQNIAGIDRPNIRTVATVTTMGIAAATLASAVGGCTRTLGQQDKPKVTGGDVRFGFADIPGEGNTKVLNYALVLETLEAELYRQSVARLTTGGKDNRGNEIAGLNLGDNEPDVRFVRTFAKVEGEHRDLLRTALSAFQGFQAVKSSKYDFGVATMDRRQLMEQLYVVERTGAAAYLGAIKFFPDNKYVRIAAAIQGTEARHYSAIGAVNNLLFGLREPVAPMAQENHGAETPREPNDVLAAVSKYIIER